MEEGLVSRIKQPTLYVTSVPKCQNSLSLKYCWFVLIASILTDSVYSVKNSGAFRGQTLQWNSEVLSDTDCQLFPGPHLLKELR